jgi:hypothetical protein
VARRIAVALLVLLSACAEPAPPTLSTGSVERAIPVAVWPEDPDLVEAVTCPDLDIALIAQTTSCTATLDGEAVTLEVAVDNEGAAAAAVAEPLFLVSSAAEEISGRLVADLALDAAPVVECARTVVVARPGASFGCRASRAADDTLEFAIQLIYATGGWTLTFVP